MLLTGSSTGMSNLYKPPVPIAQLDTILLPNELPLQKFSSKQSIISQVRGKENASKCICENSPEHLANGSVLVSVYVTTERIIFTLDQPTMWAFQ